MNQTLTFSLSLVALVFSAGCTPAEEAPGAPVAVATEALDPVSVLAKGGDFRFVFDESTGIADEVKARCARESSSAACVSRIRAAGALEGWRFVPIDGSHARLESYGLEAGTEELFLEVPVTIEKLDGRTLRLHPDGTPRGTRVEPGHADKTVTVDVRDADTFAVVGDAKGPVVYRRMR